MGEVVVVVVVIFRLNMHTAYVYWPLFVTVFSLCMIRGIGGGPLCKFRTW